MSKISAKSGGSLSLDQLERNQLRCSWWRAPICRNSGIRITTLGKRWVSLAWFLPTCRRGRKKGGRLVVLCLCLFLGVDCYLFCYYSVFCEVYWCFCVCFCVVGCFLWFVLFLIGGFGGFICVFLCFPFSLFQSYIFG